MLILYRLMKAKYKLIEVVYDAAIKFISENSRFKNYKGHLLHLKNVISTLYNGLTFYVFEFS